nr:hypothetical protein [Acidobacteriota bacterium]
MKRAGKLLVRIALAAAALLMVLAVAAVIVVQTDWFRNFAKQKIITATESGTGGKVDIGSFTFDWRHLRSTFTNLVVHGEEPAGAPPYLQAQRVQLDIRLFHDLHHVIGVGALIVDKPEANIMIFPDGRTNVPTPKTKVESKQTTLETVVDLAIARFALNDGRIVFASQEQPLNIRGNHLQMNLAFNTLTQGYEGRLAFESLYVVSGRNTPVQFAVTLPVSLRRDRINLRNATIATRRSSITINGSLENLRDPTVAGQVTGRIALADLKAATSVPLKAELAGSLSAFDVNASATVSRRAIRVNALQVALGKSSVIASGILKDTQGHPAFSFESNLALDELGRLANVAARPGGVLVLKGTAGLNAGNDYSIAARVQADGVSFQQGSRRIGGVNLTSALIMDPHALLLNDVRLTALGAE